MGKNSNKNKGQKPAESKNEKEVEALPVADAGAENSSEPTEGEALPENMTEEQNEALRVLNERLDVIKAAFDAEEITLTANEDDETEPLIALIGAEDKLIGSALLSELENLSAELPSIISVFEKGHGFKIADDFEDTATIVILDEENNELTSGTLEELIEQRDELNAANPPAETPAPKAGKKPKKGKLEDFKIRNVAWRPNNVLRVNKAFSFEGEDYQKGEVFDWQGAGMHRVKVRRLYAQRLIRHTVEDMGVVYPFRLGEKVVKKTKKGEAPSGYDFLPESLKPKPVVPEYDGEGYEESEEAKARRLEANRQIHGMAKGEDLQEDNGKGNYGGLKPSEESTKKNFSKKNDLRG